MNVIHKIVSRAPKYVWQLFCVTVFWFIGGVGMRLSERLRGIWIVAERGHDARDNGYVFFKYIREHHPEIKAYYIIDKKSPDRVKVAGLGNVVNYGSFKHHLLFSVAEKKISTHIFGYSPDILCYNRFRRLGLVRGKLIMLQHGIIMNDIEWMFYPRTVLDLLVCGAKPEYEAVKQRYGYPDGVVRYLGLCRYDNLLMPHELKNRILLMPTWRKNFREISADEFRESEYYKRFQALINNRDLIEVLESSGLELIFYPHYEAQRFLGEFSSKSDRVIIAAFKDYDVQELLMSSKLLITDFSSVFFDFAYMEKPVLMWQFDEEEFRRQNYKKGYFDYRTDGFGPVLRTEDEVISAVKAAIARNFESETEYLERAERFFSLRDTDNAKRNFEAVRDL